MCVDCPSHFLARKNHVITYINCPTGTRSEASEGPTSLHYCRPPPSEDSYTGEDGRQRFLDDLLQHQHHRVRPDDDQATVVNVSVFIDSIGMVDEIKMVSENMRNKCACLLIHAARIGTGVGVVSSFALVRPAHAIQSCNSEWTDVYRRSQRQNVDSGCVYKKWKKHPSSCFTNNYACPLDWTDGQYHLHTTIQYRDVLSDAATTISTRSSTLCSGTWVLCVIHVSFCMHIANKMIALNLYRCLQRPRDATEMERKRSYQYWKCCSFRICDSCTGKWIVCIAISYRYIHTSRNNRHTMAYLL